MTCCMIMKRDEPVVYPFWNLLMRRNVTHRHRIISNKNRSRQTIVLDIEQWPEIMSTVSIMYTALKIKFG